MYNSQVRCPECGCQEWGPTDSREADYYYAGQLAEVECSHCGHTFAAQRNS